MNAMTEARKIISELSNIIADQIRHECPACGAKDDLNNGKLLTHENDCALI